MKKNIYKGAMRFFVVLIISLFNTGCNEDQDILQISQSESAILATLDINRIELDGSNTDNPAITFSWEEANYGVQTAINYTVEIAADQAFTDPVVAGITTSVTSLTLSVGELNSSADMAGLTPFEWNNAYTRVVASLGNQNGVAAISNTIELELLPFYNYPVKDYFLVGDATAPNWNNDNNNPPLFRDPSDTNVYYYTGFYANGAFKMLEFKGQWQPQWGTNDGVNLAPNDGSDPGVFNLTNGAGLYEFVANFNTNKFTIAPFEGSTTALTSVGIVGSSSPGGTSETAMVQSSFDPHIWQLNGVRLTRGEIQFMANGSATWGADTAYSGQAAEGSTNIPILVEDDYDVWFNDLTGRYIMIPINLSQS